MAYEKVQPSYHALSPVRRTYMSGLGASTPGMRAAVNVAALAMFLGLIGGMYWVYSDKGVPSPARRNPRRGRGYYVQVAGSRAEGIPGWIRGPYPLAKAKNYARIGSQFGRDRKVLRGRNDQIVRRYSGGKRAWPKQPGQLELLETSEFPSKL